MVLQPLLDRMVDAGLTLEVQLVIQMVLMEVAALHTGAYLLPIYCLLFSSCIYLSWQT